MTQSRYDILVLGGGPGGYVAAIRAAQLGMSVAVIERDHLGGVCLNWGCIPTKALLRSAEVMRLARHGDAFGLDIDNPRFDIGAVVGRSREVADRLSRGVRHLLSKHGVTIVEGEGRLAGPGQVRVGESLLEGGHIILATGARPRELDNVKADERVIWTYRKAMVPEAMPASVIVIGSGAIGIEFASFYRDMGAEVRVIEVVDRILPSEDEEISSIARKSFQKQGIDVHTGSVVQEVTTSEDGASVQVTDDAGEEHMHTAERVILAVGIIGNTENLGLEGTGVTVSGGHVDVNRWLETGEEGVLAIGDLAGPPWLAHKASHEGIIAVERIAGLDHVEPLDTGNIPGCTYCHPQIASIGLTEAAARDAGHAVRVGRFPFLGNGKAIALGDDDGMVKTVFDADTGELLGAHMIGAEVTELIHGFAIARTLETTEAELMSTVFPHPTLSEMMGESVLEAYGRALHI